jgi:inorganic pyrophosphatase
MSGTLGRLDFRAQAVDVKTGRPVSLWHDVPLIVSDNEQGMVVNAFFEVSRGTHAKVELNKWEPHNPIGQDCKHVHGQDFKRPRYYAWSPAPGNYGALPRTWENVLEPDPITGFPGDTDPIDVVDVGAAPAPMGIACRVKVIGALGMIDGTDLETDWKIYAINVKDPQAGEINDISDVSQEIKDEWAIFWRFYKTARGLKENFFYAPEAPGGFSADAVWLGADEARQIVRSSANAYQKLVSQCLNRRLRKPYWVPGCLP